MAGLGVLPLVDMCIHYVQFSVCCPLSLVLHVSKQKYQDDPWAILMNIQFFIL